MEIEYQNSETDYLDFYKKLVLARMKKGLLPYIIYSLFLSCAFCRSPEKWESFIIIFFAAMAFFLLPGCIIYLVSVKKTKKSLVQKPALLDKRKLTTDENGLFFQYYSDNRITEHKWNEIKSVGTLKNYIYILRRDKKIFPIPKHFFPSEKEVSDFLDALQTKISGVQRVQTITQQNKPPYWIGLFCIIPLIGAIIGLIILIQGITKYKSKLFSIIGASGILFTIVIYWLLFYATKHSTESQKGFAELSQIELNKLVRNIEFYKIQHGQYPDSLQQLPSDDKTVMIFDAIQINQGRKTVLYNYQKKGNKYLLFSSGNDGIPNTKDDLFPQIQISDSSKIGLIK